MGRMEVSAEEFGWGTPLGVPENGMGVERTEGSVEPDVEGAREARLVGPRSRPARRSLASSSRPSPVALDEVGCLPLPLAEGIAVEGTGSCRSMEKRSFSSFSLSSFCFWSSASVESSRCSTLRRDSWSSVCRIYMHFISEGYQHGKSGAYSEFSQFFLHTLVFRRKENLERRPMLMICLLCVWIGEVEAQPVAVGQTALAVCVVFLQAREFDVLHPIRIYIDRYGKQHTFMISSSRLISS